MLSPDRQLRPSQSQPHRFGQTAEVRVQHTIIRPQRHQFASLVRRHQQRDAQLFQDRGKRIRVQASQRLFFGGFGHRISSSGERLDFSPPCNSILSGSLQFYHDSTHNSCVTLDFKFQISNRTRRADALPLAWHLECGDFSSRSLFKTVGTWLYGNSFHVHSIDSSLPFITPSIRAFSESFCLR